MTWTAVFASWVSIRLPPMQAHPPLEGVGVFGRVRLIRANQPNKARSLRHIGSSSNAF